MSEVSEDKMYFCGQMSNLTVIACPPEDKTMLFSWWVQTGSDAGIV